MDEKLYQEIAELIRFGGNVDAALLQKFHEHSIAKYEEMLKTPTTSLLQSKLIAKPPLT